MPAFLRTLIFLSFVALPACKRDPSPSSTARADAPAAAPSGAMTVAIPKVGAAQSLALAAPLGSAPIDRQIVQAQARARAGSDQVERWVVLGRLWVRKARESTDPGFYLNANACADIALGIADGDKLALDLRAMVLLNDHKFEEARALAQKVVDADSENPASYGNLSDALLELGRFEEAAAAAQRMMDLKPNLPAYSRASYFHWLEGDVDGAKRIAKLAIGSGGDTRDPEPQAWVMVQAATIFWHQGDFAGADLGCDMALGLLVNYPPALVCKARIAMARNDAKRAVDLLERAHRQSPLVETAWLLGDARGLAGDDRGAAAAYAIVEKDGRFGDGRTLSLFFSTKNRNAQEALALAEHEKKTRGDIYTDDALAWALYRNGKLPEAKAAVDHALRLGTRDARLLYHSGAIRLALGEVSAGKKLVEQALALNGKFDVTGASEAEKLLADTPKSAR
ncbi:MAG: hypothetical protein NVS3B20_11290 [Polyangiales bacterium]